ncbi:synaptonemal complex protein 1 isoform X3 [Synchiropus splendidus]|uniref:synaptonemal complex protein 1 isoform X3 n=1 Tax=Synchiropus splendidus TaxID=270530 RepID=UPI00237D9279|nr:synaptonemal complex protein 1 isoform X3 [Synchiropus splendidus]
MNCDRSFKFKLLVPAKVTSAPVSSVSPQKVAEICGDMNISKPQQGYNKGFETSQSMEFPSAVAAAKPNRKDSNKMKVAPLLQDGDCKPGQLYSTLLDEVEKIKCWKLNVDFEVVQKETKLKENKRIIETQRKAIQELQFGNESLSIKLEEQISENEDLRNKNNATYNLCNILKDTFERSAEKMHLFESEREETHQLFMENSDTIQKMIAGFKSLSLQVEADQQEMMKVKESLLQFEDLKERYHQEYTLKEEEVAKLQNLLQEKDNVHQDSLLDLQKTQDLYRQLQESTNEHNEQLKSLKTEQESLLGKLADAQHRCAETETNMQAMATKLGETIEEYEQIIQEKDLDLQKMSQAKTQLSERLEETQNVFQELQNSLDLEKQRAQQIKDQLVENIEKLEHKNALLGQSLEQIKKQNEKIQNLDGELDKKSNIMEILKEEKNILESRVNELNAELSIKSKEVQLAISKAQTSIKENEVLKNSLKAAEKVEEDLTHKYQLVELEAQELKAQLCEDVKTTEEYTRKMEQQSEAHRQLEENYEALSSNLKKLEIEMEIAQVQLHSGHCTSNALEEKLKESEDNSLKLKEEIQRLDDENKYLREEVNATKAKTQDIFEDVEVFQKKVEESCNFWHKEVAKKEKQMKFMGTKVGVLQRKCEDKLRSLSELQKENKMLKKEIEVVRMKSTNMENLLKGVQEESEKHIEENRKLQMHLESKSTFVAELESENHYVKLVEEKDAKLEEIRKKEVQFESEKKTLISDIKMQKAEIDQLKKNRVTQMKERENLLKEISDMKNKVSSDKAFQFEAFDFNQQQGRCLESQTSSKELSTDMHKSIKTPSFSRADWKTAPLKTTESDTESFRSSLRTTPKYKTYRVRSPPSTDKVTGRTKSILNLEPTSDSSDKTDLLFIPNPPKPRAPLPSVIKTPQSSGSLKSPGNTLKLAAMKRMREAGWTAVATSRGKKRWKKDDIFG